VANFLGVKSMPVIEIADNYAILNSDRTFKQWLYLVEGSEYNENLVLTKLTIAPPITIQKLRS